MKKVEICFHNDYYNQVCNNLDKYDYNLLFEICMMSTWHRKKILDYLFREVLHSSYEDVMMFKAELIDCDLYFDYKKSILNGNDNFLKTCLVLYFEKDLKDELYDDNLSLAKTIVKCDEEYLLKLSNLLNISQFICDDDTIKYIKDNISTILKNNFDDEDDTYINQILENNFKLIDNNQKTLKEEYSLKLNR